MSSSVSGPVTPTTSDCVPFSTFPPVDASRSHGDADGSVIRQIARRFECRRRFEVLMPKCRHEQTMGRFRRRNNPFGQGGGLEASGSGHASQSRQRSRIVIMRQRTSQGGGDASCPAVILPPLHPVDGCDRVGPHPARTRLQPPTACASTPGAPRVLQARAAGRNAPRRWSRSAAGTQAEGSWPRPA
jgi:hypothetical protein